MRTRVAVVGGGRSCEHEVSLASAASVADALAPAAYDVVRLTIASDGRWHDEQGQPLALGDAVRVLQGCDAVLPVVHGPHGEDGTLAALCEVVGVPYVGSGVRAGALAMDKWATKLVAEAVGVPTAPGALLAPATAPAYRFDRPVVVKPVAAGSSHGVTLVREAAHLEPALRAAFALDGRVLVEDVVEGREVDVAVLGRPDGRREVPPLLEVVSEGIFDLATKYDGTADLRVPAALDEVDRKTLVEAAVAVYDALGCAGVARVDFFLTTEGPVLNEVNTMPGFTAESQVPRMFAAGGTSYAELLDVLVGDVACRGPVVPWSSRVHSG